MSFLSTSLQAIAGTVTGTLLTAETLVLGIHSGQKLLEMGQCTEDIAKPLRKICAITGTTVLIGCLESVGAVSPFYKAMTIAAKTTTILVSFITGTLSGLDALPQTGDATIPVRQIMGMPVRQVIASCGQIINALTSLFLTVMSLSIHPMLGPAIAGATAFTITYAVGMIVIRV